MSEWAFHAPDEGNRVTKYKCGLEAGQRVRLKKDLVMRDAINRPTGVVYRRGEVWNVLVGMGTDRVVWFRPPDGERHTWDDEAAVIAEWFEVV